MCECVCLHVVRMYFTLLTMTCTVVETSCHLLLVQMPAIIEYCQPDGNKMSLYKHKHTHTNMCCVSVVRGVCVLCRFVSGCIIVCYFYQVAIGQCACVLCVCRVCVCVIMHVYTILTHDTQNTHTQHLHTTHKHTHTHNTLAHTYNLTQTVPMSS